MYTFIRSRAVSVASGAILLASLFSMAPVAQAATLSATQINAITNLLQAFGADPAVVANVQAVLEGTATSTPATSSSVSSVPVSSGTGCNVVSDNLQFGSSGEDVLRLQAFLSKDKSIYPEGTVTGYFGPMTEDAVQRWQAMHNIVATGTPSTTGFGSVGPQTLREMKREMEMECEGGDSSNADTSATSSESHSSSDTTASSTSSDN